ncbi:MAG: hypothetical protein JSU87_01225 [Gemmatimonadota bacterium]|nr:MAG: hypothetical protein JSU87_01225 [Gemmatimonadota bacterium]
MAGALIKSSTHFGAIAAWVMIASSGPLAAQVETADPAVAANNAPAGRRIATLDMPISPTISPSPDGRFLAVMQTRPDPVLWIVPTDGGEPFAFRKMWAAYKPRWAASGNRIGFIAVIGPPRVWTIEMETSSGRPLDPPRLLYRTPVNAFAFSPDAASIALVPRETTAAGASEVHVVNWETRSVGVLLRERGVIYQLDWSADGRWIYYGLAPALPADTADSLKRVDIFNGSTETVLQVGEYLGLSADGGTLLYRPVGAGDGRTVETASLDGAHLSTFRLPNGSTPTWGPSATLLQVRTNPAGDEIWAIPTPNN